MNENVVINNEWMAKSMTEDEWINKQLNAELKRLISVDQWTKNDNGQTNTWVTNWSSSIKWIVQNGK